MATAQKKPAPLGPAREAPEPVLMHPGGRPTKYRPDYHCRRVVELGREGLGREEIAEAFDVVPSTLDNWKQAHPEFLESYTRARAYSAAWWARTGRENVANRDFNSRLYQIQVMNRHPDLWRDRREVALDAGGAFLAALEAGGAPIGLDWDEDGEDASDEDQGPVVDV